LIGWWVTDLRNLEMAKMMSYPLVSLWGLKCLGKLFVVVVLKGTCAWFFLGGDGLCGKALVVEWVTFAWTVAADCLQGWMRVLGEEGTFAWNVVVAVVAVAAAVVAVVVGW